jgi:hypothetical protein
METICTICKEKKETRYIDLFVFGSEGCRFCHKCEMLVVEFIRKECSRVLKETIENYRRKKMNSEDRATVWLFGLVLASFTIMTCTLIIANS